MRVLSTRRRCPTARKFLASLMSRSCAVLQALEAHSRSLCPRLAIPFCSTPTGTRVRDDFDAMAASFSLRRQRRSDSALNPWLALYAFCVRSLRCHASRCACQYSAPCLFVISIALRKAARLHGLRSQVQVDGLHAYKGTAGRPLRTPCRITAIGHSLC